VSPSTALVAATAVHLGFQLTVTLLVYPAFRGVPSPEWPRYHRAHARRITPVVAVVYGAVVAAGAWLLLTGEAGPAAYVAVAASAVALGATALLAAPAHGRLSEQRSERDLTLLLRADRVRLAAAVAAAVAAVGSAGPQQSAAFSVVDPALSLDDVETGDTVVVYWS